MNIIIIGATSAIAESVARLYAKKGNRLYLMARDDTRLQSMAADLKVRGADSVETIILDVNHFEKHQAIIDEAFSTLITVDLLFIAHGTLPNQKACEREVGLMLKEFNTNALSTLSLLTIAANKFEKQQSGSIAAISSVAGDRGRQSNYVYGAAKGMVSLFLQGLRNRLYASGVNVLDIKPGFVDTPMTVDFPKGFLWAQPMSVAKQIVNSIDKKKNTLYTPCFWQLIMLIIKQVPESIFKRLKL